MTLRDDPEPAQPGERIVIQDATSIFHGEIGVVCDEPSPFPDESVWLKLPGWPSMSWSLDHVRRMTDEDWENYRPFAGPMGMGYVPDATP